MSKELIERVWDYANDIVSGKILACKKHIQACERFFGDMDKVEDEDFPYYFDVQELIDFNDWALTFRHKEGILAGQAIELTDFQLFIVANIFSWKRKDKHTRRFKRAYIQLARKQAKSQLQALIASYVGFLTNEKQQIYIAGITKEQSKIVYQQMLDQINEVKILKGKYTTSYGITTHLRSGSIIQPLSKEARKTGDGKFPSLAIIDEYHAHETDEIYNVLSSGMVGRQNALIVVITTAGLDLNVPCYREYQYCSKILDPANSIENDDYFILICELDEGDDIKDERNWIKANPIVATYDDGMEDLRSRFKIALDQPEKMNEFMTKNLNIWVQGKKSSYMDLKRWNACGCRTDESPDLKNKEVYIGIDLSSTLDLTSVAFLIPQADGKLFVKGHSFLPEEALQSHVKSDKVPYKLWVEQGWISTTPDAVVDYRFVQKYIEDIVKENNWTVIAVLFDDWNASQFTNEMTDAGFKMVKVIQGMKTLAPATKDFRDKVFKGEIVHENDPLIQWAMSNAITKVDHAGNFMLDKSKSTERIDPVASIMTAYVMAANHEYKKDLNKYITDAYLDKLGW